MSLTLLHPTVMRLFSTTWPLLLYATVWSLLLLITVGTASSLAQLAYMSVVSPSPSSPCGAGFLKVPLDVPSEKFCLPIHMMKTSDWDFVVPIVFAGLLVSTSAFMIRSLGFWEIESDG
ncbi:unnamed protein product [Cuscuta epithymum]|uniref:Uncharacterized protein n=1 Tax=Cuscuta epithymum TaxID=186058 RepID=A0AAV0DY33_9ASTE|nr:unnamed protein product [Cuscuta epithymum]